MDGKWVDSISDLKTRRQDAELAGGQAGIEKQHSRGKLTARERMQALFDDDTFVELNSLMTSGETDFGMDK